MEEKTKDIATQVNGEQMQDGTTDKLFNIRPVLFCALYLCLGILFFYTVRANGWSAWLLFFFLPFVLPFTICRSKQSVKKSLTATLVFILFFFVGGSALSFQLSNFSKAENYNGEYAVTGRVIDCATSQRYVLLTLDRLTIDEKEEEGKLNAYLPASFGEDIKLSDKVLLRGKVQTYRPFKDDFNGYLIENDIRFTANADDCVVVGENFSLTLALRDKIGKAICTGMDQTPASVTIAMLTGNVSLIDEGLLDNVRRGGIAHIFAVSGLHIGALFAFCTLLIKKTALYKMPKPARMLFVASVLLFYGGVCGFSASVVRATVTCLAVYFTSLIGIGKDGLETISFACIVVLLISPISLFCVGFQLSFGACIGIAVLSRPIREFCFNVGNRFVPLKKQKERENHPKGLLLLFARASVSTFSVALSAQIFTAPILLHAFGYFSVWALLLNCLLVPLISFAFPFLFVLTLTSSFLPAVASRVLLFIPNVIVSVFLLLFETTSFLALTPADFTLKTVSFALYYLAFTFLSDKWNLPRGLRIVCFVILITAFTVTGFI